MPTSNHSNGNNNNRRITHADIGREAGVSKATVSLTLSNHPRISEATKIRVKEAIKKLGYTPDPMLAALSQYRMSNQEMPVKAALAWINPLKDPSRLRKFNEFNLYWKGAEETARQMGFNLQEFSLNEIPIHRLNDIFKTRNIRGLIITPLHVPDLPDLDIDWKDFPWADYSTIRFGRSTDYPEVHLITSAQTANTMMAYERIRKKGYKRIGFVGGNRPMRFFKAGFYMAQSEVSENERLAPLMIPETASHSDQLKTLKKWITDAKPDAILVERQGISQMLNELNIRVPEDIGLATSSIHDTLIDAGIDQNPEEIGRAAIRMLAGMLNQNNIGIPEIQNEILIAGSWVDGSMLPDKCEA